MLTETQLTKRLTPCDILLSHSCMVPSLDPDTVTSQFWLCTTQSRQSGYQTILGHFYLLFPEMRFTKPQNFTTSLHHKSNRTGKRYRKLHQSSKEGPEKFCLQPIPSSLLQIRLLRQRNFVTVVANLHLSNGSQPPSLFWLSQI